MSAEAESETDTKLLALPGLCLDAATKALREGEVQKAELAVMLFAKLTASQDNAGEVQHLRRRVSDLKAQVESEQRARASARVKYQGQVVAHLQRATAALLKDELTAADVVAAREGLTSALAVLRGDGATDDPK